MAKPSASVRPDPVFIDNPAIAGRGQNFTTVTVATRPGAGKLAGIAFCP